MILSLFLMMIFWKNQYCDGFEKSIFLTCKNQYLKHEKTNICYKAKINISGGTEQQFSISWLFVHLPHSLGVHIYYTYVNKYIYIYIYING